MRHGAPAQSFKHLRDQSHMCAIENAYTQPVDVLVLSRLSHRFHPLPQTGVNHMKAGVSQPAGYHFDATVMAVQANFGEENALRRSSFVHGRSHHDADGRNRSNTSAS